VDVVIVIMLDDTATVFSYISNFIKLQYTLYNRVRGAGVF